MKTKKVIPFLLICGAALSGCCNGTKKVSYDVFHDKALEVEKNYLNNALGVYTSNMKVLTKQLVNGKITVNDTVYKTNFLLIEGRAKIESLNGLNENDTFICDHLKTFNHLPSTFLKLDNVKYYVGNGFKVISKNKNYGDVEIQWDEYLRVTKIKGTIGSTKYKINSYYTYRK